MVHRLSISVTSNRLDVLYTNANLPVSVINTQWHSPGPSSRKWHFCRCPSSRKGFCDVLVSIQIHGRTWPKKRSFTRPGSNFGTPAFRSKKVFRHRIQDSTKNTSCSVWVTRATTPHHRACLGRFVVETSERGQNRQRPSCHTG